MKIVALLCLFAIGAFGQDVRDLTYSGLSGEMSGTCSVSFQIHGLVPAAGRRRLPVAIYIPGTNEPFESRAGTAFITRMEALGFAAFVVSYPNRTDGGCPAITAKAACIFNSSGHDTALSAIQAAVPQADLTRIVTAGISQGAQIAVIAGNNNANVRAGWAIGVGNILVLGTKQLPMQRCMDAAGHRLKSMEIFAANAYDDRFFNSPSVNDTLKATAGNTDCNSFHNSNGSGCKVIQAGEFQAGSGHTYPFSDYIHWSQDAMIDWGLVHVSEWLCNMAACRN